VPNRLVTVRPATDAGDGPAVVLVHGVGIGAWAFAEVAAALVRDHRVLVPHRRGYGPDDGRGPGGGVRAPESVTVGEQVDDLLALLAAREVREATFVGVSGGATLVLALAMTAPTVVGVAVVHEPALGPLAPDLHAVLLAAAARLAAAGHGPDGVRDFMAGLVGEDRMSALPPAGLKEILRRWEVVRLEVPAFVAFAPSAADLTRLSAVNLVTSVGARSPAFRQLAAGVLLDQAGARVDVLDGVRHLPQLEAPEAFEKLIRGVVQAAAADAGTGPAAP